jgi:DNA processing protein
MAESSGSRRRFRLALLLAGGGAPCRRRLATAAAVIDPEGALVDAGGPPALLRTAHRLEGDEAARVLEAAAVLGWRFIVPGDDDFPVGLVELSDPPLGLFVRGCLVAAPTVAVVGSRRATAYGLQVARMLGEELARSEVVVVSGMARGIDAAAHRAVLAAGGVTWAVWGAGPDRVYPPEHRRLAEDIAAAGALITEHPPGTPPRRHHFPERNRLIAGACRATVVVEAAARSGALSTARSAVDEGREVLAVPGPIFSNTSAGPNALLGMGARPLLTAADVLELVGAATTVRSPRPGCDGPPGRLLEHLPFGSAATVDELATAAGIGAAEAVAGLLELEVGGAVDRMPDGRYARRRGMAAAGRRVCEMGGTG